MKSTSSLQRQALKASVDFLGIIFSFYVIVQEEELKHLAEEFLSVVGFLASWSRVRKDLVSQHG